jgi:hypothetical protein
MMAEEFLQTAKTGERGHSRGSDGAAVELVAEYEPDEETEARVLLMILGLPPEQIERVVENMRLDSSREM